MLMSSLRLKLDALGIRLSCSRLLQALKQFKLFRITLTLTYSYYSAGNSATPTEDVHNALRESAIAMSDLTDALASRPQRRGPAPAPVGGVTKARQMAPSGRKAAPRVDANGQPSKRTLKACLNCRYVFDSIPQDNAGWS